MQNLTEKRRSEIPFTRFSFSICDQVNSLFLAICYTHLSEK